MSSRHLRGHRLAGRSRSRSPAASAVRLALRLAGLVLAASGVVCLLEAVALGTGAVGSAAPGGGWPLTDLLATGAVLVAPLVLLLGGWRLARGHADALRELAVDDLTGTWSRRAFGEDLPEGVVAASAAGRPLTLALVELTGVSAAADLLGRRRTEALVRCAATTLSGSAGVPTAGTSGATGTHSEVEPLTYRLTGEVFAVVLPGAGPDAAFGVVDALLDGMARAAAPLSAVAGLCTLDVRCPDAQLLLLGAWAALDEAHALGPGRVVASADEESGLRWLATPPPSP
jgi:GGDEF domain-containing protein